VLTLEWSTFQLHRAALLAKHYIRLERAARNKRLSFLRTFAICSFKSFITLVPGLAQKYGIQGYPTIKYFPAGPKSDPEEYDGGRTSGDIVNWALERHTVNIPAPEAVQVSMS